MFIAIVALFLTSLFCLSVIVLLISLVLTFWLLNFDLKFSHMTEF